jgi:urease accessory protein
MSVNVSPSEVAGSPPQVPGFVRAAGGVRVAFGATPRGTRALRVAESGGYRVRFPRAGGCCEAVLINTGGGMAGGDAMRVDLSIAAGAEALVTTQAAEKVYRSQGPDTRIDVALTLGAGARLAWMPQEAILFSGARVARHVAVAMPADASLTMVEAVVFGRTAMGETFAAGAFADRWRIRRDGRLAFAEDVRLGGRVADVLALKACGGAARALAVVLVVAPDAEARLDDARAALAEAHSQCAASAWEGMLVARFLSSDAQALRADLVRFLETWRGRPMPRSWQT